MSPSTPQDAVSPQDFVFISYAHEPEEPARSALKAKVRQLADTLRKTGVQVEIDQYQPPGGPAEGWVAWMSSMVEHARFVIMVCTATYKRRFDGSERGDAGRGVIWEGLLLKTLLHESRSRNHRLVPVLFDDEPASSIPVVLRSFGRFTLPAQIQDLYRHLTAQPKSPPPSVGDRVHLPPEEPAPLPDAWATLDADLQGGRAAQPAPAQPVQLVQPAQSTLHLAKQELEELLLKMFSGQDLRYLIAWMPDGERLARQLPGRHTSDLGVAKGVVAVLNKHSAIDDDFFALLRKERPRRVAEIDAVARMFGL